MQYYEICIKAKSDNTERFLVEQSNPEKHLRFSEEESIKICSQYESHNDIEYAKRIPVSV